ncbi:MAG: hypothetical protein VYE18_05400 [Pseudomonadota bacterium]|nr:hypothetical protein [Pseudomonadota bacterium]
MKIGTINDTLSAQLSRNQANSMDSLVLITRQLVERMQEERRDQAVNFDRADLVEANRDKAKLMRFKARVADNVAAATKAKSAVEWTKRILGEMKTELETLLGSNDAASRTTMAASFNTHLASINNRVDGAKQQIGIQTINLVGGTSGSSFETDNIFSPVSERGGLVMIEGAYIGTKFNIQDSDGFLWRLDETSNTYIQYKTDGTGERTGASLSAEGLTDIRYDHDTSAVQLEGLSSLSGTVVQGGIGVLPAKFYSDFADDAAIQQAIDDIDAAATEVLLRGAPISADAALIDGNIKLVDEKVRQLNGEIQRIKAEEFDETAAVTRAANLKMRVAVNNINMVSQFNSGLIENMLEMVNGPGPAPGVFGILGL